MAKRFSFLLYMAVAAAGLFLSALLFSCGGKGSTVPELLAPADAALGLPLERNLCAGDIVLADGSKVPAADAENITAEQASAAVGIVCDPAGRRMIGVRMGGRMQWAPQSSPGYTIKFKLSKSDGSGNWAVIQARRKSGWADAASYPAFYFAQTYRGQGLYRDGWYLPAVNELKTLCAARTAVSRSLEAVTGQPLEMGWYWSSSMKKYASAYAYYIGVEEGFIVKANKGVRTMVLTMRSF